MQLSVKRLPNYQLSKGMTNYFCCLKLCLLRLE